MIANRYWRIERSRNNLTKITNNILNFLERNRDKKCSLYYGMLEH